MTCPPHYQVLVQKGFFYFSGHIGVTFLISKKRKFYFELCQSKNLETDQIRVLGPTSLKIGDMNIICKQIHKHKLRLVT